MLYNLLYPLAEDMQVFNLFKYLTFRTGGAMMTAMILSFAIGRPFIRWLRLKKRRSPSAPTARKHITKSKARRPWAG